MIVSVGCNISYDDEIISRSRLNVKTDNDFSSPLFGSSIPGNRDCVHCSGNKCYGHIGHITSPYYLCNPLLIDTVNNLLSRTCTKCHVIYKDKIRNCQLCGQSINNIVIGTSISTDDARQELIRCNSYLSVAFTKIIPVIPRMMRPKDITCNNEYSITNCYINLLRACNSKKPSYKSIYGEYHNLILSTSTKYNTRSVASLLKSKDGLFRSYMVGKRVDNCGRAVIVGTDLQDANVVSLPKKIYNKMRISISVTDDNISDVIKLSSMGKLYTKKGELVHISSIILGKTYMRNLYGDDRILLNRQPSLSKYSLMSFKVESNDTNAMMINTSVTSAYAADFDGDEMNVFLQDNDGFRSDTRGNMRVEANAECLVFIQDVVTVYYSLTRYPKLVTKDIYCDSCMICNRYDILYNDKFSTRDLLSLPLPSNIMYNNKDDGNNLTILYGNITSGYIRKSDLNNILKLVTILDHDIISYIRTTQALVSYLTTNICSISIGLDDIDIVNRFTIDSMLSAYDNITNTSDQELDIISYNISNMCSNEVLQQKKDSSLWNIVLSGAKGTVDNIVQMSISLGHQRVNGKITNICKSSFLSGLTEEEYIYHQRSSREGLVRTNVHTADAGYTARRLCKALSTTRYCADGTIRDGDVVICDGIPEPKIDINTNLLFNI